ncbi:MAG: cyclophilin-like fold protein [Sphaerochaetaceae bacterium]
MMRYKPFLFVLALLTMVFLYAGYSSGTTEEPPLVVETTESVQINTQEASGSNTMNLQVGERILRVTLVENSSTEALKGLLATGPITINMRDYGNMEKVGSLEADLPRNDQQITTAPGDLILFQGSALVIYYESNSWNFTRLGTIDNITQEELKNVLGDGNVVVSLSLD